VRRFLGWLAAAILTLATLALVFGPGLVENAQNSTLPGESSPSARARTLAESLLIIDLHSDTLLWGRDFTQRSSRGHVDVPRLIEGNVAIQVFTIVTKSPRGLNVDFNESTAPDDITPLMILQRAPPAAWRSLTERALLQCRRFDDAVVRSQGKLTPIRDRASLDAYLERRKSERNITAGILGIEGAHALDGNLENLDRLYDSGVRLISPTHFFDNDLAGSSAGAEKGGLTEKGRELIRRMEAKGMIIDLAHASEKAMDDILAAANGPVICSHTGVQATCDTKRNLSDRHLKAIAATGGVIGIAYFDLATCGIDIASIVRAMRHAVKVVGVDHVALGSDFDGAVATPFDSANLAILFDALLEDGFTADEIRKIAGENILRVIRGIWR
jgi:membrane dipeptidase